MIVGVYLALTSMSLCGIGVPDLPSGSIVVLAGACSKLKQCRLPCQLTHQCVSVLGLGVTQKMYVELLLKDGRLKKL